MLANGTPKVSGTIYVVEWSKDGLIVFDLLCKLFFCRTFRWMKNGHPSRLALYSLKEFFPDVVENGWVGIVVALPVGQVVLDQGYKGDGSLAWVKTTTSKGDLYVALVYDD